MNSRKLCSAVLVVSIILALLAAGCARRQAPVQLTAAPGEKKVAMTAGNFKFDPARIQALAGDDLVFEIANTTSITHNFTIKNPEGRVLESVDLPGNETVSVRIHLHEAGIYEFYCDRTFHTTMGMKGHVEVLSP